MQLKLEKGWYNREKDPKCLNCKQLKSRHTGFKFRCPESQYILGLSIEEIKRLANARI